MKRLLLALSLLGLALILAVGTVPTFGGQPVQKTNLMKMLKEAKTTHPQISVAAAKRLIATEKSLLIIDVREPNEFTAGNVPGAVNVVRGLLEFRILRHAKNTDRPILIYCRSGARGSFAGKALKQMGYTNVQNMAGGYLAWAKAASMEN